MEGDAAERSVEGAGGVEMALALKKRENWKSSKTFRNVSGGDCYWWGSWGSGDELHMAYGILAECALNIQLQVIKRKRNVMNSVATGEQCFLSIAQRLWEGCWEEWLKGWWEWW